ncbi:matrix protein [Lone star tick rhabdovirus]|uniref:Matrix protein n=1 Tax=Lone star tick rhabdovirus TaxID=1756186 RepID=A0A1N7TF63_9RHAB|nr:matrix protein [Lone star tick rhabdovirus]ALO28653.1 matrix protein [Lone star tick rhabdovirus]
MKKTTNLIHIELDSLRVVSVIRSIMLRPIRDAWKKIKKNDEGTTAPAPSAPSTSQTLTMEHPYLEGVTVNVPPPLNPGRVITDLNLELDFKMEVVTNKVETDLARISAPLINLQWDYKGDLRYKNIWMAFAMVSAFGLEGGDPQPYGCLYKMEICRGIKIKVESSRLFETPREFKWNQYVHWLADGIHSEWTFRGQAIRTCVNYKAQEAKKGLEDWLNSMGVPARRDENKHLILIIDQEQ